MITQNLSIMIDRESQVVFEFLSEPANLPRWNPTIQTAEWSSGDAHGVGSGFRARLKMRASKELSAEITAWEPPRRWGYALRTPIFPMSQFETTYSLEPAQTGTQLSVANRVGLVTPLLFLEGLFARMGDKEVKGNLARLKGILEG